jgi:pyridoxamine-phosphate oxidase
MHRFREQDLDLDPVAQFRQWFGDAQREGVPDPEWMVLGTVDADGTPFSRVVLLKEVSPAGFTFYTNYQSRKAQQLAANPRVSLLFYWQPLSRQVRIRGSVEKVSTESSDRYFASRPRESQLGAWASEQSEPIPDRATLEGRFAKWEQTFAGKTVPRPPHWGGYLVRPVEFEFWQAGAHRLHDRFVYRQAPDGWKIERLSP